MRGLTAAQIDLLRAGVWLHGIGNIDASHPLTARERVIAETLYVRGLACKEVFVDSRGKRFKVFTATPMGRLILGALTTPGE
jgi:hypothetical protein